MRSVAAFAIVFFFSSLAFAEPTKQECLDNNANAQILRKSGKVRAARQALVICGDPACPAMVRDDCQERMDEIERALPTIVFDVKDGNGADLSAVKVTMDGEPLAEKIDGNGIVVDVGEHEFAFETQDQPIVKHRFVIKEGEKGRREAITIGKPTVHFEPPAVTHEAGSSGAGVRIAGFSLAGAGLAGVGIGVVLGIVGTDKNAQILKDCPSGVGGTVAMPVCTNPQENAQKLADQSSARSLYTGEIVSLVAGGALLATGVVMILVAPTRSSSSALRVRPTLGGLSFDGKF